MSSTLVQARLVACLAPLVAAGQPVPEDIQWMPPGAHTITPYVAGEPKELTITVDAALAERFRHDFARMVAVAAEGRGDKPYLDFGHEDKAASGEVLDLYWAGEDPKTGGIRAKVKWSTAGRAALEGREYRRFSPQWLLHEDTLEILGLGENLGGLVNRAAFQTIQPVVARRGDLTPTADSMKFSEEQKTELTQLIAAATKPIADKLAAIEAKTTAAPGAATAQAANADIAALTERIKTLEANAGKVTAAQAKAAVAVHAKRGAIPPQNAELLGHWEKSYATDPDGTEKLLAAMSDNPALAKIAAAANGGAEASAGAGGDHPFVVKARKLAETDKTTIAVASAKLAQTEGALYDDYRKALAPAAK